MKKPVNLKTIFPAVLLVVTVFSCTKDNTSELNSPAYKIKMSEGLAIPASVDLPANLPDGNNRVATYYASGVQLYKSQLKPGSNPTTFEWTFIGPSADLFDTTNTKKGTHGAGPFWALTPADSIIAQHFTPAKTAPSPDGNSIDWLLLMPKNGKTPTGVFKDVEYIQRIATKGGKAPTALPVAENMIIEVPYTAIYRFTKKN